MTIDQVLAFLGGVGASLVGALSAHILTRVREQRRRIEERRFKIYMKLMDLYSNYFWFTTAEFHKEPVIKEIQLKCRDLAWQIADMLREADDVENLEDILEVLLGSSFPTAKDRYHAMAKLLDVLGKRVNPRYAKKIREISEANLVRLAKTGNLNTPGTMW
jgi:hypothetical protein